MSRKQLGELPLPEKTYNYCIRFILSFIMQGRGICQEKKNKFAQKPLNYSEALAIVSWVMDPQ